MQNLKKALDHSMLTKRTSVAEARSGVQLSKVKNELGDGMAVAMIVKLLNELKAFVPNSLSKDDLNLYAEMIVQNYWYLTIQDIALTFKKGINGDYGKVYGDLKYSHLAEWITAYWGNYSQVAESDNTQHREEARVRNDHFKSLEPKKINNFLKK